MHTCHARDTSGGHMAYTHGSWHGHSMPPLFKPNPSALRYGLDWVNVGGVIEVLGNVGEGACFMQDRCGVPSVPPSNRL